MLFKGYAIIQDREEQQDGGYPFLKEIYWKCLDDDIRPHNVFLYIYDILQFSASLTKLKTHFKFQLFCSNMFETLNLRI